MVTTTLQRLYDGIEFRDVPDATKDSVKAALIRVRLPLEDIEFSMDDVTGTFDSLYGLAWRVRIHGIHAVIKVVDSDKNDKGAAAFRIVADTGYALIRSSA